jgi:hypothetical protein
MDWDDMTTEPHITASSDEFDDIFEAVAFAMAGLDVGGWVDVHTAECELSDEDGDEADCSCSPTRYVKQEPS